MTLGGARSATVGVLVTTLLSAWVGWAPSVPSAAAQMPQGALVSTLTASPPGMTAMTVGSGGTLYAAATAGILAWRHGRWQAVCDLHGPVTAMAASAPNRILAAAGARIELCSPGGTHVLYQAPASFWLGNQRQANRIAGLALAPGGGLYFDQHGQVYLRSPRGRIHYVAGEGQLQALAVGDPWPQFGGPGRDGPGYLATFPDAGGLCWAPGLGIVIQDGQSLRWVNAGGWVNTLLSSEPWGYADGPPVLASARAFTDVACNRHGDVFFTDGPDQRLRVWIRATNEVRTVAGSGEKAVVNRAMGMSYVSGLAGGVRNGPGHVARFENPSLLAVGPRGRVYVEDQSGIRLVTLTAASQGGAPALAVPDGATPANARLAAVAPLDLPLGVHGVRLMVDGKSAPTAPGLPGGSLTLRAGERIELRFQAGGVARASPVVTLAPSTSAEISLPYFNWSLPPTGSWLRGIYPVTVLDPAGERVQVLAGGRVVGTGKGLLFHLAWRTARWPDGSVKVRLPVPSGLGLVPNGNILVAAVHLVNRSLPARVSSTVPPARIETAAGTNVLVPLRAVASPFAAKTIDAVAFNDRKGSSRSEVAVAAGSHLAVWSRGAWHQVALPNPGYCKIPSNPGGLHGFRPEALAWRGTDLYAAGPMGVLEADRGGVWHLVAGREVPDSLCAQGSQPVATDLSVSASGNWAMDLAAKTWGSAETGASGRKPEPILGLRGRAWALEHGFALEGANSGPLLVIHPGLWIGTPSGQDWRWVAAAGLVTVSGGVIDRVANPGTRLAVLWESSDGGGTWHTVATLPFTTDHSALFGSGGALLTTRVHQPGSPTGAISYAFVSLDGGRTWMIVTSPVPGTPTAAGVSGGRLWVLERGGPGTASSDVLLRAGLPKS